MGSRVPKSFCSSAASLLLLFLRLGCIFIPPTTSSGAGPVRRKRSGRKKKISPLISPSRSAASALSGTRSLDYRPPASLRSLIWRIRCCFSRPPAPSPPAPHLSPAEGREESKKTALAKLAERADGLPRMASVRRSSSSREDVFPCASCEETFPGSHLLELHQGARHALTDLAEDDSSLNIVRIIFQSCWGIGGGAPSIHRVLKIHGSPTVLAQFEDCRDSVRSRAAARWACGGGDSADERCMADGNERLRFYGTTFLCGLADEANPAVCGGPCCSACSIVRHGFGDKGEDGVATRGTGRAAHSALPEELAAMGIRRAMLLCRVVAGRVTISDPDGAIGPGPGYDSAAVTAVGSAPEDLLVVFDPRAVLACFVIVYSV
ncbi:zinc finger (C2H2 type) family protein [Wolffia australiana]